MVTASPYTRRPSDGEWRPIAKAIRTYLRHSYGARKLGIVSEVPPLRLCVYNGKGTGHFPTGGDGRPDWTDELYHHISRVEERTPRDRDMRFGYDELVTAMDALKERSADWHTVVTALDVYGVRAADFAVEARMALYTVYRYRDWAESFLYQTLRLNLHFALPVVDYIVFREV